METVGIRELKNNLSAFLRKVASGEVIRITDHGRVVAEIRQPVATVPGFEDLELPPEFWEMVARGEIKLPEIRNSAEFYATFEKAPGYPQGTAQRLIDEDRS